MNAVFFYGLFMDETLLKEKGLNPQNTRPALLLGYQLHIGERATLSPRETAISYGTVMQLEDHELRELYAGEGLEDYVLQPVQVHTMTGDTLDAVSYILPMEQRSGSNSGYATKLAETAKKLGLPDEYVGEIEAWIQNPATECDA
jgi:hypothetical protein